MENALLSPTQPVKHGKNRLKRPKFGTVCSSALWPFWKMGFKWFTLIHFGKVPHSKAFNSEKKTGKKTQKIAPTEDRTLDLHLASSAPYPLHHLCF